MNSKRTLCVFVVWAASALADAPVGRYMVTTETVRDTQTNLTWQRASPASQFTFATAQLYCGPLNLGGSLGWRLPTVKELQTLIDVRGGGFDPVFNGGLGRFWSSTIGPMGPWAVGIDGYSGQATPSWMLSVRCVK